MSLFIPSFAMGLLALTFLFRVYKRSISATIAIVTFAITSNMRYYNYQEIAEYILVTGIAFLFIRAMVKPDNDRLFMMPYKGIEKRKRRVR